MLYFEDIQLNAPRHSDESYTVTTEDIKQFAAQWDPMPFHLDEEIARLSPIGKLFASGIHSVAIGIRLSHTMMEKNLAVIAGLGWTDVRFPVPVCTGDVLRMKSEIIEKRISQSKPDRGIIISLNQLINQHDQVVTEYKISTLMMRKPEDL
jgi:acyl dehydratase